MLSQIPEFDKSVTSIWRGHVLGNQCMEVVTLS